ncbi:MAG: hypothetical protein KC933_21445 [Myxococcales bacterium]|nr:hypothetical protein [Myxococcales bacterium]
MRAAPILLTILSVTALAPAAEALPRFAAKASLRCRQCHVNPSGGGVRTRYGAETFAAMALTLPEPEPADWTRAPEVEGATFPLSGSVTDWLTIGGDLRAAFFLFSPSDPNAGADATRLTTTFFLMQADLYHAARLGSHLTLVLDIGVNSGFEAWALLEPWPTLEDTEVLIKVGRFLPALGLRTANHMLYTRQTVGLGSGQQDTGVEVTVDARHLALTLALMNGTLGTPFDGTAEARGFDKAVIGRAAVRLRPGPLSVELGASAGFNARTTRYNPIFEQAADAGLAGVDELRAGGFLMAGLGRFALLGDAVYVQDKLHGGGTTRRAWAGYVELSARLIQGLDLLVGYERMDRDLDTAGGYVQRFSTAVELFPWRFTELRVMARYERGPGLGDASVFDLISFLHVYL